MFITALKANWEESQELAQQVKVFAVEIGQRGLGLQNACRGGRVEPTLQNYPDFHMYTVGCAPTYTIIHTNIFTYVSKSIHFVVVAAVAAVVVKARSHSAAQADLEFSVQLRLTVILLGARIIGWYHHVTRKQPDVSQRMTLAVVTGCPCFGI